jgi:hypothetical protein
VHSSTIQVSPLAISSSTRGPSAVACCSTFSRSADRCPTMISSRNRLAAIWTLVGERSRRIHSRTGFSGAKRMAWNHASAVGQTFPSPLILWADMLFDHPREA